MRGITYSLDRGFCLSSSRVPGGALEGFSPAIIFYMPLFGAHSLIQIYREPFGL
jgi:hypothetical protein